MTFLFHENRKKFSDVCHGHYGRKVIYSNIREITKDNVRDVLENALVMHNQNRREIDYLYHYVSGDQPILYRTKDVRPEIKNDIVENHALEIVRFQIAQSYGEPIQYVSVKDDSDASSEIDKLNDFMRTLEKQAYDVELGDWQSTCGTAYRMAWSKEETEVEEGEPMIGIDIPDPRDNFIVYFSGKGRPALCHVRDASVRTMKNIGFAQLLNLCLKFVKIRLIYLPTDMKELS